MRIKLPDHHDGYYSITLLEIIGSLLFLYDIKMPNYDKHEEEGPFPTMNFWNPVLWVFMVAISIINIFIELNNTFLSCVRTKHKLRDAERLPRPYLLKLLFQHVRKAVLNDG